MHDADTHDGHTHIGAEAWPIATYSYILFRKVDNGVNCKVS
jgi:hypothetical protein